MVRVWVRRGKGAKEIPLTRKKKESTLLTRTLTKKKRPLLTVPKKNERGLPFLPVLSPLPLYHIKKGSFFGKESKKSTVKRVRRVG